MIHRERMTPPSFVYPVYEWEMVEKQFYPRFLGQMETIFATANGYLGMRGTFEERDPFSHNGTFVNGFHETWPIVYGEEAHGYARTGQTMLNITDSKTLRLFVDDEPFYLPTANLLDFERKLDMRAGTLDRRVLWEMASGKQVLVKSRRLVSFEHRHLAAISYEVTVLNARAPVVISSEMFYDCDCQVTNHGDPRKARGFKERPLLPRLSYANGERICLGHGTRISRMSLACGVDHQIVTECPYTQRSKASEDAGEVVFSIDAQPGEPIQITKYMAYHTSRRAPVEELSERAERTLDRAVHHAFGELLDSQRRYLDDFWRKSDVQVRGDPALQQTIRWNLFQILQAAARAEGAGVGARGLTGQAYEGHYFWDAEVYLLPFLIHTEPRIARNLLEFRHSMLDKARDRAREVGHRGALFPWRTINGEEASANYASSTAQYHIDADIIYALKKYTEVTGDEAFIQGDGAEMLVETARLWIDLGFFSEREGGRFCIHRVTGPDEYTTVVNNNAYTNFMARENLSYAAQVVRSLREKQPEKFAVLADKTGVEPHEIDEWQRAADNMYIPFEEGLGIHPQDDSFLQLDRWDFDGTPEDRYPLLLNYHPLEIYRHQVIKQADIVLAMFLLGNEFSLEQKKRNFDYYDPLTTGDSSLSVSIQSIIAFEVGYVEKARGYARYAAMMDLADIGGNVNDGAHIASIGGSWMALVYGLAGMREYRGNLAFQPRMPQGLDGIRFPLRIRGQVLEVDIAKKSATYLLREGSELTITHFGETIKLSVGKAVSVPLECQDEWGSG